MKAISLFSAIDFLGVITGAFGGALAARRNATYQYDLVGVLGLGLVSALGGGIARDVLIQHGPPLALVDVRYLYAAFFGALLGLFLGRSVGSVAQRILLIVDAAALALFAVAGATRALDSGLLWLPALLLGCVTAVDGGSLRDVRTGRTPRVFERGELYATVAAAASAVFLVCNAAGVSRSVATGMGVGIGFFFRLLALRFRWETGAIR